MARRRHELRQWNAANDPPPASDPAVFEREILPLIRQLPLSVLVRATGLTHGYLSQVRRGVKTPHARHWKNLASAGALLY
jgi:hypothetical protein